MQRGALKIVDLERINVRGRQRGGASAVSSASILGPVGEGIEAPTEQA